MSENDLNLDWPYKYTLSSQKDSYWISIFPFYPNIQCLDKNYTFVSLIRTIWGTGWRSKDMMSHDEDLRLWGRGCVILGSGGSEYGISRIWGRDFKDLISGSRDRGSQILCIRDRGSEYRRQRIWGHGSWDPAIPWKSCHFIMLYILPCTVRLRRTEN